MCLWPNVGYKVMNMTPRSLPTSSPRSMMGFLNHDTSDIWGQIILFWVGGCPAHYRAGNSISGIYLGIAPTHHDNPVMCPGAARCPLGARSSYVDSHWSMGKDRLKKK